MSIETFNTSTTWTVPAGVTSVDAQAVGGGGGGGSGSNFNEGGGGGGGAYASDTFAVSPGDVYTITVPTAASGSGFGSASPAGGDITVAAPGGTVILKAAGGKGTAAYNPAGGAGAAAADCVGATKTSGSDGDGGAGGAANGKGGDAAPPLGGAGGAAATGAGVPGTAPGGGGSGGAIGTTNSGGDGARGRVVLMYEAGGEPPEPSASGFLEWNGTDEIALAPFEWDGTDEIPLSGGEWDGVVRTELWADLSEWGGSGSVSGGRMYNAPGGVTRDISDLTNPGQRLLVRAVATVPAGSTKYTYFGFSNDTPGGAPAGSANVFIIGINSLNWGLLKGTNVSGTVSNTPGGATPGAGDYIFTGIIDETGISLSIAPKTNPGQIVASSSILRSQMPSPQPLINNVIISNSDTTSANSWGPVMMVGGIAPPTPARRSLGGVTLFGATEPIHINRRDPATGIRHLLQLPGDYDPQVGMPVVAFLHWSLTGTGATVYLDYRMANVLAALLDAGYAVLSSDNGPGTTANGTQDKYGNQAGIDDYAAMVKWARSHFNATSLMLFGTSQGGMFVQNILASHLSNRVEGIAAAASISPATDTNLVAQNSTFTTPIENAFGVSNLPELAAKLLADDLNPIAQTAADLRGVPQRFYVALDDPLTPKADHIDPVVATLGNTVPEKSVITVPTGGHLAAALFQGSDLVSFFNTYR